MRDVTIENTSHFLHQSEKQLLAGFGITITIEQAMRMIAWGMKEIIMTENTHQKKNDEKRNSLQEKRSAQEKNKKRVPEKELNKPRNTGANFQRQK